MPRTSLWLPALLIACAGLPVQADDDQPLGNFRVTDAEGGYYVSWERVGGRDGDHVGPWGPMRYTIARRSPGSPAVIGATATVDNLTRKDQTRTDRLYRMSDTRLPGVRPGDRVLGHGVFAIPPRAVLVSSTGLGFVALDLYGPNLPMILQGRGGHAVVVVSRDGNMRHALKLDDIFTKEEIDRFPAAPIEVAWLRAAWINEAECDLVLLGRGNHLRTVSLISGEVRQGVDADVLVGLQSTAAETLRQALILAADRRLARAVEPAARRLHNLDHRDDVRLRAAITLAVLGDRRGADLIRRFATRSIPPEETGQARDQRYLQAVAIEHLPEAWGEESLPALLEALLDGGAKQAASFRALVKLGSVAAVGELAGADQPKSVRLAAIGILGSIGPDGTAAALVACSSDEDALIRFKAALALAQVQPRHPRVIPVLIEALRYDGPEAHHFRLSEAAAESLVHLGTAAAEELSKLLADRNADVRARIASTLRQLGPEEPKLIDALYPGLIEALADDHPTVRKAVLETLRASGQEAIAALAEGLKHDKPAVRSACAYILGRQGRRAARARQPLAEALADDDGIVRCSAAVALGQIGGPTDRATAALIELLDHPRPVVRGKAAWSLGEYGPKAADAVPRLLDKLADRDEVAERAAEALGRIGPEAAGAVDHLIAATQHPSRLVRRAAVESLGQLGPIADRAADRLVDCLDDPDWHVPHLAAEALGRIEPAARSVAETLVELVAQENHDTELRIAAIEALGKLEFSSPACLRSLADALGDSCPEVADQATVSLSAMGRAAVPWLVRALEEPDWQVRTRAAMALARIGSEAVAAVDPLIAALGRADSAAGFYSEPALVQLGEAAIDPLIGALEDADAGIRGRVAHLLGQLGQKASPALDALAIAAKDEDEQVRAQAVLALARIAGPGPETRAVLAAARDDPSSIVRRAARIALGWLPP